VITIIQESLITFRRNTDHDHPGIAITIVRESLITIPRNPHVFLSLKIWLILGTVFKPTIQEIAHPFPTNLSS